MSRSLLEDAFAHHVWATLRLIDTCLGLAPEQLEVEVPGTFGPILPTMRHLVGADASYLFALTGGRRPTIDDGDMGLPGLRAAMESNGAEWKALLAQGLDPDTVVVRRRDDGSAKPRPGGHPAGPGPPPRDRPPQPDLHHPDHARRRAAGHRRVGLRRRTGPAAGDPPGLLTPHLAAAAPRPGYGAAMEHRRAVARRRMVRRYLSDPIDAEPLARIARAALQGPRAGQAEGISVVVVTDPAQRAALARLGGEDRWVARGHAPWLSPAPAHLVLCVEPAAYRRRYAEADKDPAALAVPWWWVDAGAALALVLLAAVDEGLAAGFLGAHALPGLAEAVGLPAGVLPLGVITVGHRHPEEAPLPRRQRPPEAEALHDGAWGLPFPAGPAGP